MVLLPLVGFGGVFGILAVACTAAAVLLVRVPKSCRRRRNSRRAGSGAMDGASPRCCSSRW